MLTEIFLLSPFLQFLAFSEGFDGFFKVNLTNLG